MRLIPLALTQSARRDGLVERSKTGQQGTCEIGRELVGWPRRAKPESSKSRAFAGLPENARIVTALALGTDEESQGECQKLLSPKR